MPGYFAVLTIVLMLGMVLTRVRLMRRRGVEAMNFGKIDKTDFLIPPFAFFYFYLVFAAAFNLPTVSKQVFFNLEIIPWVGVFFCLAGLLLLLWSLVSFGLPGRRYLAVPPSGTARRSVFAAALWQGISGVLPSGKKVSLITRSPLHPINSGNAGQHAQAFD